MILSRTLPDWVILNHEMKTLDIEWLEAKLENGDLYLAIPIRRRKIS